MAGLAAVALIIAVVGIGTTLREHEGAGPPARDHAPTGGGVGRYVALGDSYTAGPGTGTPTGEPRGCARSANNYPHLVAAELAPAEFVDVSCGGATTVHLTTDQETSAGVNPPQLAAVTADTTLVTLGIGGNDVGFVQLAHECVTSEPNRSPCRDRYVRGSQDRLAEAIDAASRGVGGALDRIQRRAPRARVLVVGYPTVLPAQGPGCWPELPVGVRDVAYLRESLRRLNDMLAQQARSHRAEFVDTARPSVGHDMCAPPGLRWVEGLTRTAQSAPLHPNAQGQLGMADAVLRVLDDEP
ncbi:GDSL-like Lipase/Acylhydrolase family protein [Amycolatopsis arida]|uniref:GDSL-like Lipase/Acylhydrolase family protein n=1 Tax=Amycolatopsis arida TaxID=587909 RepID=A0A1I6A4S7_9PSEU|nr:SGNH/GDSL hydrolase family protein [Amycolatopsis arida]TDX88612.1 GDSL-like lipase/acylhydrolase family protein [Amycolatopsis arida]SFQ63734.1 GDSL-like Lipase/Acylhydrolase family protein [Amycolatopsis arida]